MKNKGAILIHVIFWAIIGVPFLIGSLDDKLFSIDRFILFFVYPSILTLSIFYINYFVLVPQLVKKEGKFIKYIIALLMVMILSLGVRWTVIYFFGSLYKGVDAMVLSEELIRYFIITAFWTGFLLVFSLLIKLSIDWFQNERTQRHLETEKREMELQFLKSQLNPHFLFNALNNIYSLAYQKSEKTAGAVLKLSEIMRYMIYESNDSKSDLGKEVEYLKSYIELHKLRFKDGGAIHLHINGEIDGQQIVPLILISFIENAFKHGVANDHDNPIIINLIANQKILHFSVKNKKNKDNYKDKMGGVGLTNVERRLQLMYPDRYKLNIVNTSTHYTTELMLDL